MREKQFVPHQRGQYWAPGWKMHSSEAEAIFVPDWFGFTYYPVGTKLPKFDSHHFLVASCKWNICGSYHNPIIDIHVRLIMFQNAGERGSSFRSKFLCGGGRKKRSSLPDFPKEPEPNKTLDVTNIV